MGELVVHIATHLVVSFGKKVYFFTTFYDFLFAVEYIFSDQLISKIIVSESGSLIFAKH